jgi:acyl carrier protein
MQTGTGVDVREQVREIVRELAPNQGFEALDSTLLVDELEYTSLTLTELAFTLEDEFDLAPIDEVTARAIATVGDICDHVLEQITARNGTGA